MSDRKNNDSMDEYKLSKKESLDHDKHEESAKKSTHEDEMNEYEGRREERRKSLENAFMQTMDPFA